MVLQVDEFGSPVLPDTKGMSLPKKKEVFRSFVTMSYRKLNRMNGIKQDSSYDAGQFTNNQNATVPWLRIRDSLGEFIDAEYLPDGQQMMEPTKMKKDQLKLAFDHWESRQASGLVALKFKSARDSDMEILMKKKKAKTRRYVEVPDDDDISDKEAGPSKGIEYGATGKWPNRA